MCLSLKYNELCIANKLQHIFYIYMTMTYFWSHRKERKNLIYFLSNSLILIVSNVRVSVLISSEESYLVDKSYN